MVEIDLGANTNATWFVAFVVKVVVYSFPVVKLMSCYLR